MIKIKTLAVEATLEYPLWSCEESQSIENLLNSTSSIRPFPGYEPDLEIGLAEYIISVYGGEIIFQSERQPGDKGAVY